jgi:thiosulfate reductase cytochrome b subunit
MQKVRLFSGFERFWHLVQLILIFGLLLTGFNIHGTWSLMPFEQAVDLHTVFALSLIGLWVFAIFWDLTTGEWRQYVPTGTGLMPMVLYYAYGIFSGETKPYKTVVSAKHNPLQRLAYLGFKVAIAPALWTTGLLLLLYPQWGSTALGALVPLASVAWLHVAAAFALMLFLIVHIYMAGTTGDPWYAHLKAMFTDGYEQID